jgi:hypothetical protein
VADARTADRPPQRQLPNPPANAVNLERATALAKIGAHVPLYGIPSVLFGISGFGAALAAERAFAACFLWGNAGENPVNPDFGDLSETTQYITGEPPYVPVFFSVPDKLPHPRDGQPPPGRVFPFLAVAAPTPVLPIAPPARFQRPELGSYDNLFALGLDAHAYLAVPNRQVDEAGPQNRQERTNLRRDPRAYTALPAHRIYQLTIASSKGRNPPPGARTGRPRTWDATRLQYADATASVDLVASAPTFAVLANEPSGYRMAIFSDKDQGRGVVLARVGHRVLPQSQPDIYLGNRFRTDPEHDGDSPTAPGNLGGIEVAVDHNPWPAKSEPDGRVRGLLMTLSDGRHTLSVQGACTQAGPPGPATKAGGLVRRWRQRSFDIEVKDRQVVRVDDEIVLSQGVRILIDPVYMRLRSGIHANPNRNQPAVTLFVVHRPEQGDARKTLGTYQKTVAVRFNEELSGIPNPSRDDIRNAHFRSETAAAYLLAKDGTLIKGADDNEVVNHAPGHWTIASNPPRAGETQQMSVGVEISKFHDDPNPYTEAQYAHLLWLLGQYITMPPKINPMDVVGHSDIKDVGKDDPGLTFEWARLEAQGFGLRRAGQPLVRPYAPFPATINFENNSVQQERHPTAQWQATITTDVADFNTLFAAELALPTRQRQAAVDSKVNSMLRTIGYYQNLDAVLRPAPPNKDNRAVALLSFRSHFFAGSRRILFALDAGSPNSDGRLVEQEEPVLMSVIDMWKLTAVWIWRVHTFIAQARASTPPVQPLPLAPR